jgi:hypothetical protein
VRSGLAVPMLDCVIMIAASIPLALAHRQQRGGR